MQQATISSILGENVQVTIKALAYISYLLPPRNVFSTLNAVIGTDSKFAHILRDETTGKEGTVPLGRTIALINCES